MNKVAYYSRILRLFVTIALTLMIIVMPLVCLAILTQSAPLAEKLKAFAIVAISSGLEIWAYALVWKILSMFMQNRIFESVNARRIIMIAWLKVFSLATTSAAVFLKIPVIANLDGQYKDVSFIMKDSSGGIVTIFTFLIIGYILEEACRLHEEGKLTI